MDAASRQHVQWQHCLWPHEFTYSPFKRVSRAAMHCIGSEPRAHALTSMCGDTILQRGHGLHVCTRGCEGWCSPFCRALPILWASSRRVVAVPENIRPEGPAPKAMNDVSGALQALAGQSCKPVDARQTSKQRRTHIQMLVNCLSSRNSSSLGHDLPVISVIVLGKPFHPPPEFSVRSTRAFRRRSCR